MKNENPNGCPEEPTREDAGDRGRRPQDAPEPPVSWRPPSSEGQLPQSPDVQPRGPIQGPGLQPARQGDPLFQRTPPEFERIRKYISLSQICAVISLFIGGVVLGSVALVFGLVGFSALSSASRNGTLEANYVKPLRQSCNIALVMSATALVVNIVALIYLYPLITQAVDTGDFSSLFGGGGQIGSSPGTSSTTWG